MPSQKKASTQKSSSWGPVADWYSEHLNDNQNTYHAKVILPNLMRLVAPKEGVYIADIACGEGFFSREFAKAGARVLGTDISTELIAHAKSTIIPGADFITSPSNKIPTTSQSFDVAIIILALQNIKDLSGTIKEASRILKNNGCLYIVLNHPVLRAPGTTSWIWDNDQQKQVRRIDAYLTEREIPIVMHPSKTHSESTVSYHRPLQSYIKALTNNGFLVSGMEEWISHKHSQAGPRQAAENLARKEFPLFLMIKAVNVNRNSNN